MVRKGQFRIIHTGIRHNVRKIMHINLIFCIKFVLTVYSNLQKLQVE